MTPNEARSAYRKQWYQKNKDKVRQYNLNYWTKKAALFNQQEEEKGSRENTGK